MDSDTSRDEFCEQMGNSGGSFTISGHDYSPFEIFSKLFGPNLPLAERRRFLFTDLNDGPMADHGERGFFVGQKPAQDEEVGAIHQHANHSTTSHRPHWSSLSN